MLLMKTEMISVSRIVMFLNAPVMENRGNHSAYHLPKQQIRKIDEQNLQLRKIYYSLTWEANIRLRYNYRHRSF